MKGVGSGGDRDDQLGREISVSNDTQNDQRQEAGDDRSLDLDQSFHEMFLEDNDREGKDDPFFQIEGLTEGQIKQLRMEVKVMADRDPET